TRRAAAPSRPPRVATLRPARVATEPQAAQVLGTGTLPAWSGKGARRGGRPYLLPGSQLNRKQPKSRGTALSPARRGGHPAKPGEGARRGWQPTSGPGATEPQVDQVSDKRALSKRMTGPIAGDRPNLATVWLAGCSGRDGRCAPGRARPPGRGPRPGPPAG